MELENMVFARDYTAEPELQGIENAREELDQMMDVIRKSDLFKDYETALNAIPKMIVPKHKAVYDDLLKRLDEHTNRYRGKIRGEVNYETGSAWIEVILPLFEAVDDETRQLFADAIQASLSMNFTATGDGDLRLYLLLSYFEDFCDDDIKDELLFEELVKHRDVIAAMAKPLYGELVGNPDQLLQDKNI